MTRAGDTTLGEELSRRIFGQEARKATF